MFKKPNFFIVGAPKCGTTSLANWLSEHPSIFLSNPKEPHFFDLDRRKHYKCDLARYEGFFNGVAPTHTMVGEATTGYLRSHVAISEILKYAADARFIVGLRNPVQMAISWHGQTTFEGWENEPDFEKAWRLQEIRRVGDNIPPGCPDIGDLMYADVCALGSQLARLYEQVPQDKVFVYTLDELRDDTPLLWQKIQHFLGVPDDGRRSFPVLNEAKRVPNAFSTFRRMVVQAKINLGMARGFGLINWMSEKIGEKPTPSITNEFEAELYTTFQNEVELLQNTTNRDFSDWLRPPGSAIAN